MNILLVEDDKEVSGILCKCLRAEHHDVELVEDGDVAIKTVNQNSKDIILLDLMLPGMTGDYVLKHLRAAQVQTPVIIMTGLFELHTKVKLFDLGADDYLIKPFEFQELLARMKAALRRQGIESSKLLIYEDVVLDKAKRQATRAGKIIDIKGKRLKILEYMLTRPEQVLTRDMIMDHVWGPSTERFANVVDVHIHHIREKLDKPYKIKLLKTVSTTGYKLSK
jgi:DNA-binding response OmpR family regulator